MSTARHTPELDQLTCYHCGEKCSETKVIYNEHAFCCDGCKLVYELLKENNLCTYYEFEKSPGRKAKNSKSSAAYSSLDEPGVREKLIRFEDEKISRVTFHVPVMHCSSCIWLLENLHKLQEGIISSSVNFPRREVTVDFEKQKIKLSEIAGLLSATGYVPAISLGDLELKEKKKKINSRILKIGIAGFCFGNIMMLSFPEYLSVGDLKEVPQLRSFFAYLSLFLSLPVLFYCASDFFVSAWKAIRFRSLNIDAPIALAIAVTFSRSVYEILSGHGISYLDSMSGIVFFMLVGRYFQDRTYENLSFERDYKSYFPISVSVMMDDEEINVQVTKLVRGDKIIIRSGELIPCDVILLSAETDVDYSFVTGESNPVRKIRGEKIFAGARQTVGAIELEVDKETSQSYLTQLWNNDSLSKRKEELRKTYIDKINRWFSAAVLLIASIAGFTWIFIDPRVSLNVLTAVLIVACPCTLLLASTFTNGNVLRWLGKKGFYLKNAGVIDRLATADTIVFDKTGTITVAGNSQILFEGKPLLQKEIVAIKTLASQSSHPLSRIIAAAFPDVQCSSDIKGISEIQGKGISAIINGALFSLGSESFAGSFVPKKNKGAEVWIAADGNVRGLFIIHNSYREKFAETIQELKKDYQVELLSGDNNSEKEKLLSVFGNEMNFQQSPQNKLDHIRALQSKNKKVIMIGDGLNDAGALLTADAGIAISDDMNNFFPACDAILDGKNFSEIPALLSFTRVAKKVVTASFIISVLYNCIGIFFAVRGELSPLIAAILMPASSFSVIAITSLSVRLASLRIKKA